MQSEVGISNFLFFDLNGNMWNNKENFEAKMLVCRGMNTFRGPEVEGFLALRQRMWYIFAVMLEP